MTQAQIRKRIKQLIAVSENSDRVEIDGAFVEVRFIPHIVFALVRKLKEFRS